MSRAFNQGGIELSFIIMAIQLFVVFLEFYVISALAIILVPFGANSYTKFLYDKVVPSIVGSAVKLMFMAFIMSVSIPLLYERKFDLMVYLAENPNMPLTSEQTAESLGVSMALAFLCWQAPTMAAGLMNGMGTGISADSLSKTRSGMNDMSGAIANSGGGTGVGGMMKGISAAMAKATGNVIPESDTKKNKKDT